MLSNELKKAESNSRKKQLEAEIEKLAHEIRENQKATKTTSTVTKTYKSALPKRSVNTGATTSKSKISSNYGVKKTITNPSNIVTSGYKTTSHTYGHPTSHVTTTTRSTTVKPSTKTIKITKSPSSSSRGSSKTSPFSPLTKTTKTTTTTTTTPATKSNYLFLKNINK